MKKIVLAALCVLSLCAGAAVLSNDKNMMTVAGSAGGIHVKV